MKKILVPFDFSDCANEALRFALDLSEASKGDVQVLHVVDLPVLYETTFGVQPNFIDINLLRDIGDDARKRYEGLWIGNASKRPARFEVLNGPVALMIREYIRANHFDLVVMGTKGASGWKEFFVGSNTEKVVRLSPVPVMTIRKAPSLKSIKNIVLPSTLALNQVDFMDKVKSLQTFFGARLHIVLLNTPMNFRRDAESWGLLEEFAFFYKLQNYQLHIYNEAFEADGIIEFAKDIGADMIAMGTHGRRGLSHLMTGSIAEDVVNHVNYPIWTYTLKKAKLATQSEPTKEQALAVP